MEFWGVEVKAGQSRKVVVEEGQLLHISQAALGDVKGKEKGFFPLRVKVEGKEFIVGSLSVDTIPQVHFDLVFHTELELSHGCKTGSVYFCGNLEDVSPVHHHDFPYDSETESQDSEDELPVNNDVTNGKANKTLKSDKPEKKKSDDVDLFDEDDSEDESDDTDSEDEEKPEGINLVKKKGVEIPSKILPVPSKKAKGSDDNCGCGDTHTAASKRRSQPSGKTSPAFLKNSKKAKNGGK